MGRIAPSYPPRRSYQGTTRTRTGSLMSGRTSTGWTRTTRPMRPWTRIWTDPQISRSTWPVRTRHHRIPHRSTSTATECPTNGRISTPSTNTMHPMRAWTRTGTVSATRKNMKQDRTPQMRMSPRWTWMAMVCRMTGRTCTVSTRPIPTTPYTTRMMMAGTT